MNDSAPNGLFHAPRLGAAHWLALSAALVAFAIVSGSLLAALGLGLLCGALQSLRRPARSLPARAIAFLLVFAPYLALLLPLWPGPLDAFYGAPIAAIAIVAALPALLPRSLDGGRGLATLAAIAGLLLFHDLFLSLQFQPPLHHLASAAAFVCLLEVGQSRRFAASPNPPWPELLFSLLAALLASFYIDFLPLAVALAALPLLGFLLRCHQLAKRPETYSDPATPSFVENPSPPPRRLSPTQVAAALALPLLLAPILYLLVLRVPFWADHVRPGYPDPLPALAYRAQTVAAHASLDDEAPRRLSQTLLDGQRVRERIQNLVTNFSRSRPVPEPDAPRASSASASTRAGTRPSEPTPVDYREPTAPRENVIKLSERESRPRVVLPPYRGPFPQTPENRPEADQPQPNGTAATPPPPDIDALFARGTDAASANDSQSSPLNEPDANPRTATATKDPAPADTNADFAANANERPGGAPADAADAPPNDTFLPEQLSSEEIARQSQDFSRFLSAFDQPQRAMGEALNLENTSLPALLNQRPLATLSVDRRRDLPDRLYLRANVLDTFHDQGLNAIRGPQGRRSVPLPPRQPVPLGAFAESRSAPLQVTLTVQPRRLPTLLLPESFQTIETTDFPSVDIYPQDRVALANLGSEPVTYRLSAVDLDVSPRERKRDRAADAYRERMLELPLPEDDRRYLADLARSIAGPQSSTRHFARRAGAYFAREHRYSFSVAIDPGPGHAVVRWLKQKQPGLCSNYAAAFALLARSQGIPTRVVTGYATDEFQPSENRYIIRQANAHAWVEYLDESSRWIRFDPTPPITEAERARVESLVTAASPASLDRLLASQARSLDALDGDAPQTEPETLAEPFAQAEIPEPSTEGPAEEANSGDESAIVAENDTAPSPAQSAAENAPNALDPLAFDAASALEALDPLAAEPTEPLPPGETANAPSENDAPAETALAQRTSSTERPPEAERPSPFESAAAEATATAPLTTDNAVPSRPAPTPALDAHADDRSSQAADTADATEIVRFDGTPATPWLLLLALLSAAFPLFLFVSRGAKRAARPAELKLRQRAGKLLRSTERLIAERHLHSDPVWTDVHQTLAAQRYGRRPDPAVVDDLAVKVALLAKSRPPKQA